MTIRRPTRSTAHRLELHLRTRGEEAAASGTNRLAGTALVVERTGSWSNCFRCSLVRWEKKAATTGMLNLACACITLQQAGLFDKPLGIGAVAAD